MKHHLRRRGRDGVRYIRVVAHVAATVVETRADPGQGEQRRRGRGAKGEPCHLRAEAGQAQGQPSALEAGVAGEENPPSAPEGGAGQAHAGRSQTAQGATPDAQSPSR